MGNFSSILATFLAWALIGIGFIGVFLPALPGCGLIAIGVLIYKLLIPNTALSWAFVWGSVLAALLALAVDYLAFVWGAKRLGASSWGLSGAIIGVIFGVILFTPFIGLIIGPLLGAFVGECIGGRALKDAFKAGIGTALGGICAFLVRFAVAVGIIVGFLFQLP